MSNMFYTRRARVDAVGMQGCGVTKATLEGDGEVSDSPTPEARRTTSSRPAAGSSSRRRIAGGPGYRSTALSITSSVSGLTTSMRTLGPSTWNRHSACWVEKPFTKADHGVTSCA